MNNPIRGSQRILAVLLSAIWLISAVFPVQFSTAGYAFSAVCGAFLGLIFWQRQNISLFFYAHFSALRLWHILVLTIAVRIGFVAWDGGIPFSDSADFEAIAHKMVDGSLAFSDPGRPPGPSWIGALSFWLLPESRLFIWLFNIAMATATVWITAQWVGRCLGSMVGNLAALFLALNPEDIANSAFLTTETGYLFFISCGLWAVVVKKHSRAVYFGLALGLAHYFRTTTVVFGLAGAFYLIFFGKNTVHWKNTAAAVASFLLVIGPIIWHNRQAYGIWSANSYHTGGWSLFLGSNTESHGFWNSSDVALMAEALQNHPPNINENASIHADRLAQQMAIERIKQQPWKWFFSGLLTRPFALWGDLTISLWAELRLVHACWHWPVVSIFFLYHKLLLFLAGLGLLRAGQSIRRLPSAMMWLILAALFTTFLHLIFNVEGRYHHVFLPLIAAWAAFGLNKKNE